MENTLRDTIDTAFWFSQRDLKFGEAHAMSDFLHQGVANLDSHLVGAGFPVPAAKAAAAKAACLAAMILGNARETLGEIRVEAASGVVLSGDALTGIYERLRALRKTAPEAYYYWCTACGYLR